MSRSDRVLIDTGPIVAVLNSKDQHHAACCAAADQLPEVVCTCWPVITEACFLLRKHPGHVERLLEMVHGGYYELLDLRAEELTEVGGWLSKYRDQNLDLADACLAYLADREAISTVFTVDRRHFSLFRTTQGSPLRLMPD